MDEMNKSTDLLNEEKSRSTIINYGTVNNFYDHSRQNVICLDKDMDLEKVKTVKEMMGEVSVEQGVDPQLLQECQILVPYVNDLRVMVPYVQRLKACQSLAQMELVVDDIYIEVCRTKINRDQVFKDPDFIQALLDFIPESVRNERNSGFSKTNVSRTLASSFSDVKKLEKLEEERARRRAEKN